MTGEAPRVVIVPCSGIGKTFGSVSREAGYELCENLRPDTTQIMALSKLVLEDGASREAITRCPVVTIDGCKRMCAAGVVKQAGGHVALEATVFDAFRRHKELRPEGLAELNDDGKKLAAVLAEEVAKAVDDICQQDAVKGERHA